MLYGSTQWSCDCCFNHDKDNKVPKVSSFLKMILTSQMSEILKSRNIGSHSLIKLNSTLEMVQWVMDHVSACSSYQYSLSTRHWLQYYYSVSRSHVSRYIEYSNSDGNYAQQALGDECKISWLIRSLETIWQETSLNTTSIIRKVPLTVTPPSHQQSCNPSNA